MKKLVFLIVLGVSILTTYSQILTEQSFYKHEVGVSCGLFATPLLIPFPYLPSVIPNLNLDYHYNFNAKHSIGFSYSIATDFPFAISKYLNKSYIDEHPEDKHLYTSSIHNSILIGYRINFLKTGKFTFYSSFFAGINIYYMKMGIPLLGNFGVLPAIHVTPLGFTYGAKNKLNFEVGIGTRGFINIGYRYYFNK
jgi:hypothetical protein